MTNTTSIYADIVSAVLRNKKSINLVMKIILIFLVATVSLFILVIFIFFTPRDRSVLFSSPQKMEFAGVARTYRISVPKNLSGSPKMIFAFHGLGGNGKQMAYFSALHNSTGNNTIVVYPDSTKSSQSDIQPGWNAEFCCGSGWVNKVDDVGYIKALVASLSSKYNVNPDKIYATGFSNGGMFIQRIATEQPDLFAGYVSVSGNIGTEGNELRPTKPVAIMHIHGDQDKTVPFNGGPGGSDPQFMWGNFDKTLKAWEKPNNCSEAIIGDLPSSITTTYKTCVSPLKSIIYKDKAHIWPDWRLANVWHKKTDGSNKAIEFLNGL